jgi:hypothetical protein
MASGSIRPNMMSRNQGCSLSSVAGSKVGNLGDHHKMADSLTSSSTPAVPITNISSESSPARHLRTPLTDAKSPSLVTETKRRKDFGGGSGLENGNASSAL